MVLAKQRYDVIWNRYNFPINMEGCVLYVPLWQEDMKGTTFLSYDQYHHILTPTGTTHGSTGRTFNGTDDTIDIPHNAVFNFGTGDFAIEVWFRSLVEQGLCGKVSNSTNYWQLYRNGTKVSFELYVAGVADASISTTNINDDTWRLVTISRISGTTKLYLNTTEEDSDASTKSMNFTGVLSIGQGYTNEFGQSVIGEVLIYNRGLTAPEITHVHNTTKWRYS